MTETQTPVATIIRVLLVDDHPTVLLGLRAVLSAAPDIDVIAAVTSGEQCLEVLDRKAPDVVVLDLGMPGQGGLETLRIVLERSPETAVLVLTASAEARDVTEAIRRGASGYLLKDTEGARLIEGVRAAGRGELPLDARVTRHLLTSGDDQSRIVLSRREHDVLRLLRLGLSNKLIAERLGIQEKTVKTYLTNAYASIGVSARTSAAVWARQHLDDVIVR